MSASPIVPQSKTRKRRPVAGRFWEKVQKTDTCWLWKAGHNAFGYGVFKWNDKMGLAHRWSYEQAKGPIPEGLEIDHLCRVRNCVNPDHMEAVTHRVNMFRAEAPNNILHRIRTCKNGHPINSENTARRKSGPRKGQIMYCKICWKNKYGGKYN